MSQLLKDEEGKHMNNTTRYTRIRNGRIINNLDDVEVLVLSRVKCWAKAGPMALAFGVLLFGNVGAS